MKVLFIGNSHSYFNDMPATFADMCEKVSGKRPEVAMLAYSWKDFEWHMTTEYFTVRFNILYGGYDYCIIQQAAHPFPGLETTKKNAKKISDLCKKVGTKLIVIETWPEKAYPEHGPALSEANREVAKSMDAILAPAGTVWKRVGEMDPGIDLYWKDGEHAGVYGAITNGAILTKIIAGGIPNADVISHLAKDFLKGMELDFHNPKVMEETQEISVTADKEKIATIIAAIEEIL